MRDPHPYDEVLKAQGRDCYRCRGYGWDTWLPSDGSEPGPRGWPWAICRDCGGTGKKRTA